MKREILEWNHKDKIKSHLAKTNHPLSEYCFANLYFFRNKHQYTLIEEGESLYVEGVSYDNKKYLMPLQPPGEKGSHTADDFMRLLNKEDIDMIFPLPEEWLSYFPQDLFSSDYNENDSDYIYESEHLALFAGKQRQKKRNLKKQFEKLYTSRVEEITEANTQVALNLLDVWQNEKDVEIGVADYLPCKESLEKWNDFKLHGYIIYADEKPAGFLTGEEVGNNTFTIHFAKGDITYKGIYSFMFSALADRIQDRYQWINMEQDLGNEGLRKTKRSYKPSILAHKYRLSKKIIP